MGRHAESAVITAPSLLASFLINAWEAAVLCPKVEKNGTPVEQFE